MTDTLGDRIKNLRKKKGWTQEKLAAEVGASKTYIYFLEKNQRQKDPSVNKLKAVADALETNLEYLITGNNTVINMEKLDPELKDIYMELIDQGSLPHLRSSGQFDTEGLKSILEFIRFIKQKSANKNK